MYLTAAIAALAAYQTMATCWVNQLTSCHPGGPATRTIPADYPCAGSVKSGTDGTGLIFNVRVAVVGDTGHTGTSTTAGVCGWGFDYLCNGNMETAWYSFAQNQTMTIPSSPSCWP